MAVLKCKMCGGELAFEEGATVCECEYCGSKQTIPNVDDEKRVKLYERANRLRLNNEFDKAYGVYESIIAESSEEAEAYWGLVLCKFGIEYVDDPATGDKVPTCHRSSFDSVMDDENFEMVMENADSAARSVYREQAKAIEEIRKGIIEVSSKEEPYDIFICYKETDENGDRTVDSLIAQDTYDALTEKGYKVFFSRITLEDKLGQEYEPYIFAALNSAKVMLVFGTDYEYFNAVWVKNEWSRFLQLMSKGEKKTLIPCYKNLDAYDIPKEFARLQAQDMGKVGAIQDLVRGVEKIIPIEKTAENVTEVVQVVQAAGNPTVDSLMQRIELFLDDRNWASAKAYCEKVLDIEPQNAKAYLYETYAIYGASTLNGLGTKKDFETSSSFKNALRFADNAMREELELLVEKCREAKLAQIKAAGEKRKAELERQRAEEAKRREAVEKRRAEEAKRKAELEKHRVEKELADKCRRLFKSYKSAVKTEILYQNVKAADDEIKILNDELAGVGFFNGKRKKELSEKIDAIAKKKRFMEKEIAELESKEEPFSAKSSDVLREELRGYAFGQRILNNYDTCSRIKVGDDYIFGSYGNTDIEWKVLAKQDSKILVISKYGLDSKPYNKEFVSVTWKKCSLRQWLNNDFIKEAFSNEEAQMIMAANVPADKKSKDNTNSGEATWDKVFLLSIAETEKYFRSSEELACKPTDYAVSKGVYVNNGNGNCEWWLRDLGSVQNFASNVKSDCEVNMNGNHVYYAFYAVRPAMWIDLDL